MKSTGKAQRVEARIGALRSRHAALETSIRNELGRPLPDSIRMKALKKLRLRTKDEIHEMLGVLRTIGRPGASAAGGG